MNDTVQTALATYQAALTATATIPEAPFYYGSDLWCESDLHPRMEEVADTALVIAQHVVRRLGTPPGTLPDDDDWGIDVGEYCNRPTTTRELQRLEGEIAAELIDDDRIETVAATVVASSDYSTLTVTIRIEPADPEANEFTLTLSVSDIGLLIEELRG